MKYDIPKCKANYFYVFNHNTCKFNEIKYLSQSELADGWEQVYPKNKNRKLINKLNVTLAFLPKKYWSWNNLHKIIKDGITHYTLIETNQDDIMKNLFNEIYSHRPNTDLITQYINELDESQHNSWLVLQAKKLI